MGFASSSDAAAAQKYYDKTFMDATRLEVAFAQKYGSEAKQNAWSKYTEGTSRYKERQMATGANAIQVSGHHEVSTQKAREDDPKLQEFLALMQPRHKKAVWSNDDIVQDTHHGMRDTVAGAEHVQRVEGDVVFDEEHHDSDEEYEQIVAPQEDGRVDTDNNGTSQIDEIVVNKGVSDLDYLKSRMKATFSDEEDDDQSSEESKHDGDEHEERQEVASHVQKGDDVCGEDSIGVKGTHAPRVAEGTRSGDKEDSPEDLIQQTARLFLRNLPYSANEDDIRSFLEPHGELEDVHIIVDKATRKSKGYALVTFVEQQDAVRVFHELDGSIFMGRLLHILPGKAAPSQDDGMNIEPTQNGTSSFKRDKEMKMKKEATNKVAWNTLFMRSDTVAEAVADMYNMSKSDLLDPTVSDMAVRLALGEVKVINMTKEYLEESGVRVELLEAAAQSSGKGTTGKVKRSDSILIVKNLPFSLDEDELKSMFTNIGPVLRWVLPPSHTLALVEFSSNQDASRAFKSLTFKRYKSVPIYLEWAPRDIFDHSKRINPDETNKGKEMKPEKKALSAAISTLKDNTDDPNADSCTIFIKNLAFKTKKSSLEKHFKSVVEACGGKMKSAKIAQRKKDGKQVSAGFGFVECSDESVARNVIQNLQGSSLDGHQLVLQLSQGNSRVQKKNDKRNDDTQAMKQASSKVLVRNLAFEATRQDVLNLFTALAEVKSCRLPKKFDGSHRGFAFVEFASTAEAKTAMTTIAGTHLYGRRLVIEWASEDPEEEQATDRPLSAPKRRKL